MSYINVVSTHRCEQPNADEEHNLGHAPGTVWQCDHCKKMYRLVSDQRDGMIWIEIDPKKINERKDLSHHE